MISSQASRKPYTHAGSPAALPLGMLQPSERRRFGIALELVAWDWLVVRRREAGRNLTLLHHGFQIRAGELDLVFEEGTTLVFAEVRARQGDRAWVSGLESVTFRKRQRLKRAAQVYLMSYRGRAREIRWDVIAFDGKKFTHIPDAWRDE